MERSIILNRIGDAITRLKRRRWAAICVLASIISAAGCADDSQQAADDRAAPAVSRGAIETSLNAAEEYLEAGEYRQAEAILTRLIDRAPDEVDAHEMYGQLLMNRAGEARQAGFPERAKELLRRSYEHYRRTTELLPGNAGLHQSAGEIAHAAGLVDDALQHYRLAGRTDPSNPRHAILASQILIERAEFDQAERLLERAIGFHPDEPLVHATLATLYGERKDWNRAVEHARIAREISSRDLSFRVLEASLHRRRGEPRQGVQLLVQLDPAQRSLPYVATELAFGLTAMEEHDRVAEIWREQYEANPVARDASHTAIRSAEAYLLAGNREQAWIMLREARMIGGDEQEIEAIERALREMNDPHRSAGDQMDSSP